MRTEAKTRLISFQANEIHSIEDLEDSVEYAKKDFAKAKKLGKLGGFVLSSDYRNRSFFLSDNGLMVAFATTGLVKGHVNSVAVIKRYQGKGLGMLLYEFLLKQFGTLYSSDDLSAGSSRAWAILCEKHNGVLVVPRNLYTEEVHLKPLGFKVIKGITYPILQTDRGPKDLKAIMDGAEKLSYDGEVFRQSRLAAWNCYYKVTR